MLTVPECNEIAEIMSRANITGKEAPRYMQLVQRLGQEAQEAQINAQKEVEIKKQKLLADQNQEDGSDENVEE